jgi:hypothetical protein
MAEPAFEATYRALSYGFRVWSDLPSAGEVLGRLLAPFAVEGATADARTYVLRRDGSFPADGSDAYELLLDGAQIQRVPSPGSMVDWLIADFSRQAVEGCEDLLAVHAAVASLDGEAVLMSAPPDAGKTTLVAGLTLAGFSFLTDEVALIDPATRWVHPFPRPLMIEPGSMDVLDGLEARLPAAYEGFRYVRHHVAPDDLRPGALGSPCPIRSLVIPSYRADGPTALAPIHRAEALELLARQTFNFGRLGRLGFETLAAVVRAADCYTLAISDLARAIASVGALYSASRRS